MRATASAVWAIALLGATTAGAAEDPEAGDLRDLKVGAAAADLPREGYVRLACAEGDARLEAWTEFGRCPAGPSGLRGVTFEYDDSRQPFAAVNDAYEGTKIAGHPVRVALLFAPDGTVEAIRAETSARQAYLKKKAFLLSVRIRERYGPDGWVCEDRPPASGRSEVGGMYLDRHCEKDLGNRRVLMDTRLFRDVGESGQDFTSATIFEVRRGRTG